MNLKTQIFVIEIAPGAAPKTKIATLPLVELETCADAADFLMKNSFLPADAEIDEKNIIVGEASDADCEDAECDEECYGDREGCYLTFTAGEVHYHVIVKEVLF